jgi:hypothetical protein
VRLCSRESQVQDIAADVVKVHVNEALGGGAEVLDEAWRLVVQRNVIPEFILQPFALVVCAGQTENGAAMEFGNLAYDTAGGSCGSRDDYKVSRLDLTDVENAEVGRQARKSCCAVRSGAFCRIRD